MDNNTVDDSVCWVNMLWGSAGQLGSQKHPPPHRLREHDFLSHHCSPLHTTPPGFTDPPNTIAGKDSAISIMCIMGLTCVLDVDSLLSISKFPTIF